MILPTVRNTAHRFFCTFIFLIFTGISGCESITIGPSVPYGLDFEGDTYPKNSEVITGTIGEQYTIQTFVDRPYVSGSVTLTNSYGSDATVDTPPLNTGEFHEASMPIRGEFDITGTEYDLIANFKVNGANGEVIEKTIYFGIEATYAKQQVRPDAAHDTDMTHMDILPSLVPQECDIDNTCDEGGGGGGGGGGLRPAMVLAWPSQSQEPFIRVTNENDGYLSRQDVSNRAAQWSPQARAFYDSFYREVYPDDYDGQMSRIAGVNPSRTERADFLRAAARGYTQSTSASSDETGLSLWDMLTLIDEMEPFLDSAVPASSSSLRSSDATRLAVQVFPNPTSQSVSIRSAAPERGTAMVFDSIGRMVFSASVDAMSSVTWSLQDRSGTRVSPGLYVVRVQAGGQSQTQTVTVL